MIFILNHFYTTLYERPKAWGIGLFCVATVFFVYWSIVLLCVLYAVMNWGVYDGIESVCVFPSLNSLIVYMVSRWKDLYIAAWLLSAAEHACEYNFGLGRIPAHLLYWSTFKHCLETYPHVVAFNVPLALYTILFTHCWSVMLYGLIKRKPKVDFRLNIWTIAFRTTLFLFCLVFFVLCPPVFGIGFPADFETGDPLRPFDFSKPR